MAATYVDVEDFKAGSPIFYVLSFQNHSYTFYNAAHGYRYDIKNDYSIQASGTNGLRFEVRPGDTNWFDEGTNKERSEIGSTERISKDDPFEISYTFNLEPGERLTSQWTLVGQIHNEIPEGGKVGPPPVAFTIGRDNKLSFQINYDGPDGTAKNTILWKDSGEIVRGHDYDIDIKAQFDAGGKGRIVLTIDGVTVVDYTGKLGYTNNGDLYWKEGIYRSGESIDRVNGEFIRTDVKETVAATYSDLKIHHGDMVQIAPPGKAVVQADAPLIETVTTSGKEHPLASLQGKAGAHQKVNIYDGSDLVKTVTADSKGIFKADIALDSGSHKLTAAVVDSQGWIGKISAETPVEVGTAAEILDKMNFIATMDGLKGLVLTDTNTFLLINKAQMTWLVENAQDTLKMVDGGVRFELQSGFADRRISRIYDVTGKETETITHWKTDGVLVKDVREIHMPDALIKREVIEYGIKDKSYATELKGYDAKNKLIHGETIRADGSRETVWDIKADGSKSTKTYTGNIMQTETVDLLTASSDGTKKLVYQYNIEGKSYDTDVTAYDGKGNVISVKHITTKEPIPPSVPDHIDAPTLTVSENKGHVLSLSGTGDAGARITLFSGTKIIETTTVDAQGHYAIDLAKPNLGLQSFAVKQVSQEGLESGLSAPVSLHVLSAAGFLSDLSKLSGSETAAPIWIFGGNTLNVHYSQIKTITEKYGSILDNVVGDFKLSSWTGTSDHRLLTIYNTEGKAVETYLKVLDKSGGLVREVYEHLDTSARLVREVFKYSENGNSYQGYDASGKHIITYSKHADGTFSSKFFLYENGDTLSERYDSTGKLSLSVAHEANGTETKKYYSAGELSHETHFDPVTKITTFEGHSAHDKIYGTTGDDIFGNLNGGDLASGGKGADTFVFDNIRNAGVDKILDFKTADHDKLDLSNLLSGYDNLQDDIHNFVLLSRSGNSTLVSVDQDGTGAGTAQAVAILENVTLTNLDALLANQNLIV